ncbi:MAG TPA: TonB-dependent receptor [Burkholderiaceae bacterium]|nr:TonB-dependent receptor [Burkholderiaceae bacterium]
MEHQSPHFAVSGITRAVLGAMVACSAASVAAQSVQQLDTVVVTAAGHEQQIIDAPASISVITREELEKKSYTDIVDAVQNIPGVHVTGGGSSQDISIRGMAPSYTLYLVDGRPVSSGRSVNSNGQDGGKQIGLPPLSMIERIEVIRGPMSSLYGSEAMGGVVNIITRKVTDTWQGSVNLDYTKSLNDISNDGQNGNFYVGGPLIPGRLGLRVNGGYTRWDESDFPGGDDNAESRPKTVRRQGGAELMFTPNDANTFTLGMQSSKQETTHTPGKSVETTTTGLPSTYEYKKDVYTLSHDGKYGKLWLNSYIQHDVSEKVQDQQKKEKVTLFNTQANYLLGDRHMLTFGGQFKQEEFVDETNGLLTSNIPGAVRSVDRWIGAVFAEAEWALRDDFTLTTGLRYNRDELFGGHFSPRVYGVYHHTDKLSFKGGVSTGYKQPSLSQATAGFGRGTGGGGSPAPHPRALIIGNPDLEPETSTNYEFGLAFNDPDLGLNSSVMLFHTQFKDKISEDRYCESPAGNRNDPSTWECAFGGNDYFFLSTSKNISKAMMQGVEASMDYRLAPAVKLSASYTFTRSEQQSGEFKGEPLNKIPRHMANVQIDWDATDKLNLWAQGTYRGKTSDFLSRTTMDSGTPAYTLVDVGLVYRINDHARVKAGIYNLADKKITNDAYGVVLDGRRFMAGLTLDF